jgi:hypothetical protein
MFSRKVTTNKDSVTKYRRGRKTHFNPGVPSLAYEPGFAPPLLQLKGSGIIAGAMTVTQSKPTVANLGWTEVGYPQTSGDTTLIGLTNPSYLGNIDDPSTWLTNIVAYE